MAFGDKYNQDNVLIRAVILSLLDLLNRKIQFEQVVADDDVRMISIPFYFGAYGTQRFLDDFYMNYRPECDGPVYVEGGVEPVPRGSVVLSSISVNTAALTNKFVRGTYNKETAAGVMEAYSAYLNVLPLTMGFDVEIWTNGMQEACKIVQETLSTFYKAAKINSEFRGFRVESLVGFSADYVIEKPITFTYGDDDKVSVKFPLELETYLPVVDKISELHRGKNMRNGIGNVVEDDGLPTVSAHLEIEVKQSIAPPDISTTDANGIITGEFLPGEPIGQ